MLEPTLSPALSPVVVVDDEGLYLAALTRGLERRGMMVVACPDLAEGEAAYRRLEGEGSRPALVVDLIQPGDNGSHLGGLDLLRRLQPSQGRAVVAVMDSDASWLDRSARSLGATRVIRKPDLRRLAPEHMDQALNRYIAMVAGEAPPAAQDEPHPIPERAAQGETQPAGEKVADDAALIIGALEELRHVRDRVGVLLLLMRLATELTARGMLLEVAGDHLKVLGCFGTARSRPGDRVPLDRDSLPARAFWSARMQRTTRAAAQDLPAGMGSEPTGEAMAMPILGNEGVIAVLYADAGEENGVLADLRPLMTLAGTARLALCSLPARCA